MKRFFEKYWPIFGIITIVTLMLLTNHVSNVFLTGGDNLHPEFNLGVNIKRSIFSVWQEYQGLGLLAGMGHASDLPRQILLAFLANFMPVYSIRYFYTFLTLLVGAIGSYFLIFRIVSDNESREDYVKNQFVSLAGALFYLLNLATLQQYYTAFEVFTAHFAALPWLILTAVNYFQNSSRKNLLIAGIVVFLATPAAYVPTLFIVYLMAVGLIALLMSRRNLKGYFKHVLAYFLVVFLVNAFWLLPFIYFVLTNSSVVTNAQISRLASQTIFLQNKEFGDLKDVILLKGFWFNNVEPDLADKNFIYMLSAWRDYLKNPAVQLIGIGLFVVILSGLVGAIKRKTKLGITFAVLFIFSFTMIATATPPFSFAVAFLRDHMPLFGEVFRFPFTKFSLLVALSYSIFLAIGIKEILRLFKAKKDRYFAAASMAVIALIMIFVLPTFKGHFFYYREQIQIPSYYFDFFKYMNSQNPNQRIADFPQYQNWEWNFYDWGYSGSGFVWYGINQPVLSRTFDTWSGFNEGYYWELTEAMYSKNPSLFDSVLDKYQVPYLYIDNSIQSPSSTKGLFKNELKEMIASDPSIHKIKTFGSIELYSHDLPYNISNFVTTKSDLPKVSEYKQTSYDSAYLKYSDYIASNNSNESIFYPFRSALFSRKGTDLEDFQMTENKDYIEYSKDLPEYKNPIKLSLPSPITNNNTLPIEITASINSDNNIDIGYRLDSPSVYLSENGKTKLLWKSDFSKKLFETTPEHKFPLRISVNGGTFITLDSIEKDKTTVLGTAAFSASEDNIIVLSDSEKTPIDDVTIPATDIQNYFNQDNSFFNLPSIPKNSKLIIRSPKVADQLQGYILNPIDYKDNLRNCDQFRNELFSSDIVTDGSGQFLRLVSKNASPCLSIPLNSLEHDQAYAIFVDAKNVSGRGIHFWVLNDSSDYSPVETYLPNDKSVKTYPFVLEPMENYGQNYSLHLDNISIGSDTDINDIGRISVYPIPYYFLSGITLGNDVQNTSSIGANFSATHPNQTLYDVTLDSGKNNTLILSQAYDKGWQAYKVNNFNLLTKSLPFIFGKRQNSHEMVNNWENGWQIDQSGKYVLVYLPQYLEYAGFILAIITFPILILLLKRKKRVSTPSEFRDNNL